MILIDICSTKPHYIKMYLLYWILWYLSNKTNHWYILFIQIFLFSSKHIYRNRVWHQLSLCLNKSTAFFFELVQSVSGVESFLCSSVPSLSFTVDFSVGGRFMFFFSARTDRSTLHIINTDLSSVSMATHSYISEV